MNYYQHHIGDFIRDTARLTDQQSMAYLRLIWLYYETEEPLEIDEDALAFKTGANALDVHQILKHFFFQHEERWHHSRCDKEILAFREKSKKAKDSANARWKNADAMRTHTKRNANEPFFDANQEPVTNISITDVIDSSASAPKPKKATQLPVGFYPNANGVEYAEDRKLNIAIELTSFRNWHESKGTALKDWQAGWRTWCDKAVEYGRAKGANQQPRMTQHQLNQQAIARSLFGDDDRQERLIEGEVVR
jgi:uncharacterized protein YdaU (DUF1376 family)